ncbi:MAG: SH3 domain-containing protein [Cyclobacteriaceae bacterium]
MKIIFYIIAVCASLSGSSQSRDYKGTLIQFHRDLLNGSLKTPYSYEKYSHEGYAVEEDVYPGYIKKYNSLITEITGNNINVIAEKIRNSPILDYGSSSSVDIDLIFGTDFLVYSLNKYENEPITIGISLNGLSLYNHIIKDAPKAYKTERYAIIDDPDGYTNVREEADVKSEIIAQIKENRVFIYHPNPNKRWLKVRLDNEITGYMHISRIKPVHELDDAQKKQVEKCNVRWEECFVSK